MIPRNLPKLMTDALHAGWGLDVYRVNHRGVWAVVAQFDRGGVEVLLAWDIENSGPPRLIDRAINHTPTPYAQCVRLIRSKETS